MNAPKHTKKIKVIQYAKNGNDAVTKFLEAEHINGNFYKYEDAIIVYYSEYGIGLNVQNADEERLPGLVEKYINTPWNNPAELIKAIKELTSKGAYFFKNTWIKFMENISLETAEMMKKAKAEYQAEMDKQNKEEEEKRRLEAEEEKKREQAQQERELQEKKAKTYGYADAKNMSMMQLGKFLTTMEKSYNTKDFGYCNRIEFCVRALKSGCEPKAEVYYKDEYSKYYTKPGVGKTEWMEYQMKLPEGGIYTITKTQYDFSVWMQSQM